MSSTFGVLADALVFSGMDPYLEAPSIWPDLHHALASALSGELNESLPSPYYARLQMRPELGVAEEGKSQQRIIPGFTMVRHLRRPDSSGGVAVLDRPRREISNSLELIVRNEPFRHLFVEIRDSSQDHKLITVIEILGPSNKRRGPDRESYRAKQCEVIESDANLIEIDLLRSGDRVLPDINLTALIFQLDQPADYLVLVNRARRRAGGLAYQVFPCSIREWLPCIPVPLKPDEPEVPLDIQFVFNRAYDGGPYRRGAVDYAKPPEPPLSGDDAGWAEALIAGRAG